MYVSLPIASITLSATLLNKDEIAMQRIHLRNKAKTATLERLVPHLGTLEATRDQLREAKELARKTEHDLRDRIAELQDSNIERSGSSKGNFYSCLTCLSRFSHVIDQWATIQCKLPRYPN
jgi:hypothetical protein